MSPFTSSSPASAPSGAAKCCRESSAPPRKFRSMVDIMKSAKKTEAPPEDDDGYDNDQYDDEYLSRLACEECGSGDRDDELIICDKCDKGFHMLCVRPIVARVPIGPWFCPNCADRYIEPPLKCFTQKKIMDFFRIQKCSQSNEKSSSPRGTRKRRKRSAPTVYHKKRRRLLPFTPTEDPVQRMAQLGSLAGALTALNMKYTDTLMYVPGMAAKSANQAKYEIEGMQLLSKEDKETLKQCIDMHRRGECPPLKVVFDSCEGYTVEADGPIKDMTLIAEYTGDVDYLKNRETDDCDSMMTLLLAKEKSKSLVVCADKCGNIARFINGINNHSPDGRKKQNTKCVRYAVNGECRVLLVAIRDIGKGERLYYDYNGYEHEYPTEHFI